MMVILHNNTAISQMEMYHLNFVSVFSHGVQHLHETFTSVEESLTRFIIITTVYPDECKIYQTIKSSDMKVTTM